MKHVTCRIAIASLLMQTCLTPATAYAIDPNTLPQGGEVASGSATIGQSGAQMNIHQHSDKAILNWQQFNVGKDAQVNFHQPSASSVALNRVLAGDASQIHGQVNANGQVYLVNPSGVLFGPSARVDVGGLVATTHAIGDEDFLAGKQVFERNGATGGIVNHGTITAKDGGTVALIAPHVSNQGTITTNHGNVVLAAGEKVTLSAGVNGHLQVEVDGATVSGIVENGGLIQTDGGQVVMTSEAANAAYSSVVSNTGTIRARNMENREGRILLLADMEHGETAVDGVLDASAPETGDGGFIETSAATVNIADGTQVTTKATHGKTGTWLIDPDDFTIAASGGNITGATLSTNLESNNITHETNAGGSGGNGDIFVNDTVSWAADNTLTLTADRNIYINENITATGDGAGLVLEYGRSTPGSDYYMQNGAAVTLSGAAASLTIDGNPYQLIHDANALQDMNLDLGGFYALGGDIDASSIANFVPVGNSGTSFTGQFHGLGHEIDALTINRPSTDNIGLFGYADNVILRDVTLDNATITGQSYTGALVGSISESTIRNVHVNADVTGNFQNTGGLAGAVYYNSTIDNSSATGTVSGSNNYTGGLVGEMLGSTITNSYAVTEVTGWTGVGGLVGYVHDDWPYNSTISNSYVLGTLVDGGGGAATGGLIGWSSNNTVVQDSYAEINVAGGDDVGGLIGYHEGWGILTVQRSWASGDVIGVGNRVGGLVGGVGNGVSYINDLVTIEESYALGNVAGNNQVGGLVGYNGYKIVIDDSHASGNVNGSSYIGGLLGYSSHTSEASSITNSYAEGTVDAIGIDNGGLVGYFRRGTITDSYTTGDTSSTSNTVGGLVGFGQYMTIERSYTTGAVSGYQYVGGLVGSSRNSTIIDSHAVGNIHADIQAAGGLVGHLHTTDVINSYATGNVSGNHGIGGLIGTNYLGSVDGSYATGMVTSNASAGGLIGRLTNSFSITNSYATGTVNGIDDVGGLVGQNSAYTLTITDSYASGEVNGTDNVGGLVGYAGGTTTAERSFATGNVNAIGDNAGGLIGYMETSTILNAYATGNVTGSASVGGLVGYAGNSSVTNAYSTGLVNGGANTGGLVGQNVSTTVTESFWDTQTSGQATSAGGTGKTTAEMMTFSTFDDAGWSIAVPGGGGVWYILEGETTPLLSGVTFIPLTISANDQTITYNGFPYSGGNGYAYSSTPNPAYLSGTLTYGGDAQGAVNAGTYVISLSGLTSSIYDITFVDGILSILPASAGGGGNSGAGPVTPASGTLGLFVAQSDMGSGGQVQDSALHLTFTPNYIRLPDMAYDGQEGDSTTTD